MLSFFPKLIVMARDQGTVPYMDFGTVDVEILDMNDNTPRFTAVSRLPFILARVWMTSKSFTFSKQ